MAQRENKVFFHFSYHHPVTIGYRHIAIFNHIILPNYFDIQQRHKDMRGPDAADKAGRSLIYISLMIFLKDIFDLCLELCECVLTTVK